MPKTSVTLDQATYDEWKGSGANLANLVKLGLAVQKGWRPESAGPPAGAELGFPLADRVREMLDAIRGLTALLQGQGYVIEREPSAAMAGIVPEHEAHTLDGPAECRRCELLRENREWMESEVGRLSQGGNGRPAFGTGGGGAGAAGGQFIVHGTTGGHFGPNPGDNASIDEAALSEPVPADPAGTGAEAPAHLGMPENWDDRGGILGTDIHRAPSRVSHGLGAPFGGGYPVPDIPGGNDPDAQ
jgi:hypothetical protein